jgi:SAM-dependent methyltransferase
MDRFRWRVLKRWSGQKWDGWWGDHLDVRFELGRKLRDLRDMRVIDVGCGSGILMAEIDESNLKVGIDESMSRLQKGKEICPDGIFIRADILHLPFKDGSFDAIVLGNVIEIFKEKEKFLEQVGRTGRRGCRILATTPNREHWVYRGHPSLSDFDQVEKALSVFQKVEILGYNPLPSLAFFLPLFIKNKIPRRWVQYLFLPSPIAAWVPGIEFLLRRLMKYKRLLRGCKAFLISAENAS